MNEKPKVELVAQHWPIGDTEAIELCVFITGHRVQTVDIPFSLLKKAGVENPLDLQSYDIVISTASGLRYNG